MQTRLERHDLTWQCSDSVKGHLRNGVGVDLTSVMADREAGANWNARGRGEIVGKLEGAVDFSEGKE
jgi:hypothetical protein